MHLGALPNGRANSPFENQIKATLENQATFLARESRVNGAIAV